MKKTSLLLSVLLIFSTLFALPAGASAYEPKDIDSPSVTVKAVGCTFDEYKGTISKVQLEVKDSGTLLKEGEDYKIFYEAYDLVVKDTGLTSISYSIDGIGEYKGEKQCSEPYTVVAPVFGKAGTSSSWNFDKKTKMLRISGTGAMTEARRGNATTLYVSGVNSVGSDWYLVDGEEYNRDININNVVISGSVKTLSRDALRVTGVKSVDLQYGVKTLKTHSVSPISTSYKSIYIPRSVTKIEKQAVGYACKANVYEEDKNYKYSKVKGFTVIGESGTAAQKYAKKNKFKFVALKQSSVKKLTGKKGSFAAVLQKAKNSGGYELQYSKNPYFAEGNKTVKLKKAKSTKKTVKKLSAGTYYVRVRSYKTVKGKKYTSCWSKAKSVTVK